MQDRGISEELTRKYCHDLDFRPGGGFVFVPVPLERFLLLSSSALLEFLETLLSREDRLRSLDETGSSCVGDFGFSKGVSLPSGVDLWLSFVLKSPEFQRRTTQPRASNNLGWELNSGFLRVLPW
jgi:hypothetical protein